MNKGCSYIFLIFVLGLCSYFLYSGITKIQEEYYYKNNYQQVIGEVTGFTHVVDHTKGGREDWLANGSYNINGKEYGFSVSGYSASIGDKYTFYYDPKTEKQYYSNFNKLIFHPYAKLVYGILILIVLLLISITQVIAFWKWESNMYNKSGFTLFKQITYNGFQGTKNILFDFKQKIINAKVNSKTDFAWGIALLFLSAGLAWLGKYTMEETERYEKDNNYFIEEAYVNSEEYVSTENRPINEFIGPFFSNKFYSVCHSGERGSGWYPFPNDTRCIWVSTWSVSPHERIKLYRNKHDSNDIYILPGEILFMEHPYWAFLVSVIVLMWALSTIKQSISTEYVRDQSD